MTLQAGLIPRIFAYLFERIQDVQNKQVSFPDLPTKYKDPGVFVGCSCDCGRTALRDATPQLPNLLICCEILSWFEATRLSVFICSNQRSRTYRLLNCLALCQLHSELLQSVRVLEQLHGEVPLGSSSPQDVTLLLQS